MSKEEEGPDHRGSVNQAEGWNVTLPWQVQLVETHSKLIQEKGICWFIKVLSAGLSCLNLGRRVFLAELWLCFSLGQLFCGQFSAPTDGGPSSSRPRLGTFFS